ncbi:DUF523 domain-containing protein [Cloacibacillus sp. An23]|uniref:DUF523 domain-containing protein n=1 Tax=Cloacibacillus sp. An23 TaxID=1965591 RepID=UPI001EF5E81C|nr:DUF523 domain-containing protein [Cloacibacillus sp. An23]
MKILVSACLLGVKCRYDGGAKPDARVSALADEHELVPVCPEKLGGLESPREPSEISGGRVFGRDGRDLTEKFELGARRTLEAARRAGCRCAVLKERSPSCGSSSVYDGSFSGRVVPGAGLAAALLMADGVKVFSEETIDGLFETEEFKNESNRDAQQ